MCFKFIVSFLKSLEHEKHPLLAPNVKVLQYFGLYNSDHTAIRVLFFVIHMSSFFFVTSLFVQLAVCNQSFDSFLFNLSLVAVSSVAITKTISFLYLQKHWLRLIQNISKEELEQMHTLNDDMVKHKKFYTKYGRIATYSYWGLVLLTSLAMIFSTLLKLFLDPEVRNGNKPYPQVISSWVPFDDQTVSGFVVASTIRSFMVLQGGGVIAAFDSTSVAIMTFLKGYTLILSEKCRRLFGDKNNFVSEQEVWKRIAECHRHHNFLLEQTTQFNFLLSPVMFIYVFVCSMSICSSVIQLSMGEVSTSQKLWVAEYTLALSLQLFIYCWHGNEIYDQTYKVDRAIFESDWWRANRHTRRQLILLDGKLSNSLILKAGPFNTLSIATFVNIMKGAYSFYTLFSQVQDT